MNNPNGTEISAARPVTMIVPTMACEMPPPSPTTLRMSRREELGVESVPAVGHTVHTTETSGKATMTNALVTMAVTSRSLARRGPSIRRETA